MNTEHDMRQDGIGRRRPVGRAPVWRGKPTRTARTRSDATSLAVGPDRMPNGDPPSLMLWGEDEDSESGRRE